MTDQPTQAGAGSKEIQAALAKVAAFGVDARYFSPIILTVEQLDAIKQCPGLDVQEHSDAAGQAWLTVAVKQVDVIP